MSTMLMRPTDEAPAGALPWLLLAGLAASGAPGLVSCASTDRAGIEIQAYPAGVIPGLVGRRMIDEKNAIQGRLAANLTERNDWGEHQDESGEGFGGGLGWKHALGESLDSTGWLIGARVDLWSLEIDWKDPGARRGSTDVIVLQPTVEGGYGWTRPSGDRVEVALGVGAEINIDTDGEDVGEGAILLLGLTWLW